jgi:phosphocarrier protein
MTLETTPAGTGVRSGLAILTNDVGLHARPSIRLVRAARAFRAEIGLALAPDGPWADAKSLIQVLRLKAVTGHRLYFCATGADAEAAIVRLVDLVQSQFAADLAEDGDDDGGD